jgi:hypothetical protein
MESNESPILMVTLANGSELVGRFNDIELAQIKRGAREHGVPVVDVTTEIRPM